MVWNGVSLDELSEEFRQYRLMVESVSAETVADEQRYLKRFFEYWGTPESSAELLVHLSPGGLRTMLGDYASGHGEGSLLWLQRSLRPFLRFLYQNSYLERDLSALVPLRRTRAMGQVPRALPAECISALLAGIEGDTSTAGRRDLAIVSLLSMYGVRGVQIRRLLLEHIDWENSRICFPAAKGGRRVEQHLMPDVGGLLAEYLMHGRPTSAHREVFLTLYEPYGPLPNASHLSGTIRNRMSRLGIEVPKGVSRGTHGFRHAFASRMVGHVPFKDLVDLLGHRDPSSTLIYGKVDVAGLMQAALSWPGGEG
jgi:integrase